MSQPSLNPGEHSSEDVVRAIKSALPNIPLKGMGLLLFELLLASAADPPFAVLEEAILKEIYKPRGGINPSHRNSLRSLAKEVDLKLDGLEFGGLKVSCGSMKIGGGKAYGLTISLPPESSPGTLSSESAIRAEDSFKREFSWNPPGMPRRSRNVWVPVHGADSEVSFRLEGDPWVAPPGFSGYKDHRDACWKKYQATHRDCPKNSRVWHVSEFVQRKNSHGKDNEAIELTIAPVYFWDVVATTWALEKMVRGDDGQIISIYDWLKRGTPKRIASRHFVPAANPLMIEVNVITRDGKVIMRKHRYEKTGREVWGPAVLGFVDSLQDVYRTNLHSPDPSETVFRRSCQLLRLAVHQGRICWLGVGFGQEEGKVGLFGEVEVSLTADEIIKKAKSPELQAADLELEAGDPELKAVELVPTAILGLCQETEVRGHCEALLALSLERRYPKVNIHTKVRKFAG